MTDRSYEIEPRTAHDGFQRGYSFRTYRRFVLHTEGQGHWCIGGRESGFFLTEDEAREHGEIWIETGLAPADQTPERIEARRAAHKAAETLRNDPPKGRLAVVALQKIAEAA